MNINEEQNPAKLITTSGAHWEFHHSSKLHNLSSVNSVVSFPYNAKQAIEREISLSNNATLSQSELIQMFCKSYETHECCICSLRPSHLTALFNAVVLKRIWLQILVVTNKYSWTNWDHRKSPDDREIWIIEVRIIEVPLYKVLQSCPTSSSYCFTRLTLSLPWVPIGTSKFYSV